MKPHAAWLAGALLLSVVLACNFSTNSNSNSNSNSGSSSGVFADIHMAKDEDGKPGDETNTFNPQDRTVHCLAKLKNPKEGLKIKFVWWIVDAGGTKNEKIKEIDYTTGPNDKTVHGHLTVQRDWPKGKFRCELYVDGTLDKSIDYYVS
jgi:hypothetical protein